MDYSKLSPEKQAEIDAINAEYKQKMRDINRNALKGYGQVALGGLMQGASMLPIFNIPYVGTGLGGALFEAGQGVMEGDRLRDIAKKAGQGFAIGETVGAVPYVGKVAGKTKAGQAVGKGAAELGNYLANTGAGQKALKGAAKLEEILAKEFAPVQKYNNPWYVDNTLQEGNNRLKYIYENIKQNDAKMAGKLPKPSTDEIIRDLRMANSGYDGGIGAYTRRSYESPNAGVVAQYYPTKSLKNAAKYKNWETPKFNELSPNDENAQLYYDTLKAVKDKFGKPYDTVSLYPAEEYKNMRLFLSPDKANGFAIKPDGDIVSVFGSKEGSGTSHSMLELALQNKGTKLDNYDVPRLRHIYDNHGFNITERSPWNDEYWIPSEWDKDFMQSFYGVGEPDITYRQIYDTNIYPEIKRTPLYEKLMDTLR